MATYQYTPVDSSNSEIRLLKIHHDIKQVLGRKNVKPLSGTLSNHYLPLSTLSRTSRLLRSAQLPLFYALSYVWGESTKSREIFIDGRRLAITESLYNGLRAIQKSSVHDIRVWADAICINQDDTEEKSIQILLMREIYHSAFVVRIWLGSASPDATRCLDFIEKLTGALVMINDDLQDTEDEAAEEVITKIFNGAGEGICNGLFRVGQSFGEVGDVISPAAKDDEAELLLSPDENYSLHQESIKSISNWRPSDRRLRKVETEGDFVEISKLIARVFIQHEWFERMWVVQEVGAADSVEIQIGSVAIDWTYVVRAIYYLHFVRCTPIDNIGRLTGLEKIRLGWNSKKRQPLIDLIRECRFRKATNPRDKIYSLLGLMGDKVNEDLKPDYTKVVGEVYSNATRHFIKQTGSLDSICGWERSTERSDAALELPSWVPDYTLNQNLSPAPLAQIDGRESIFAASGYDHRAQYALPEDEATPKWSALKAKGIPIDSVAMLSPDLPISTKLDIVEQSWNTTLKSAGQILEGITEDCRRSLENISTLVSHYSQDFKQEGSTSNPEPLQCGPSLNDTYILDAYFNSLISGRVSPRERANSNHIVEIMKGYPRDTTTSIVHDFMIRTRNAIRAGLAGRRLVITKSGYIGSAPQETQIGDEICVLYGCSVPVALRSNDPLASYKFVGECYLHGFMDAEAIALNVKRILRERDFILK